MGNLKKYFNSAGITLVELLTAIIIISIIFISFLTIFNQTMQWSVKVEDKFTGVNIAEAILYKTNSFYNDSTKKSALLNINPTCKPENLPTSKELLGSDINLPDNDFYIVNNKKYYPVVTLSQTEDECLLKLYRIHVVIYENEKRTKALSELYDYIILN